MQVTSALYNSILAGSHTKEVKVAVAEEEFLSGKLGKLVYLSTQNSLYSKNSPVIGSCVSAEIDVSFLAGSFIPPRMAELKPFVRLASETQVSEWLTKGVFYTDTRVVDPESGLYTLHGYDAMLKAEQTFLTDGDVGEWPRPEPDVVNQIAAKMGVSIDSRTILNPTHMIPYPNDATCRELLSQVAVAHAGNWTMTDVGELRLIGLADIPSAESSPERNNVGRNVSDFESAPSFLPYSKVILWWDDENAFVAGDDTGRTLEADLSWATQAIADEILAQIKGFVYVPFSAADALIDPAIELGDGVEVNGVYAPLATMDITFDQLFTADISAPADEEIDHEYPYVSSTQRELDRKVTLGAYYYGTRITRKEGLVIKKTDGENVSAKAVFNAEELSFYDADNDRVLYFDPTTGTYKFTGELNVSDNFVVDKDGNVTIKGSINLSDGSITWGSNGPVKYQFAASLEGPWHDTMTEDDKYRRDSLDGGETWGTPYQFVGSDAAVTYANIKAALQKANGVQNTFITADELGSPNIYGGNIYGSNIFAGVGSNTFANINSEGFSLFHTDTEKPKATLTTNDTGSIVQLILGAGSSTESTTLGRFFVQKGADRAGLYYYSGTTGDLVGFTFMNDGTITVHGSMPVTAVFA